MPDATAAFAQGNTAVITGAASGIGLAAAQWMAGLGMNVVLADLPGAPLERAVTEVQGRAFSNNAVVAAPTDVSSPEAMQALRDRTIEAFGAPAVLMNNAGVGFNPGGVALDLPAWRRLMDINFWGAVNGVQAFLPSMAARGAPGAIINTGSKQGITTPPGNAAYNVSKAALKVYTEQLAHELRNMPGAEQLTAHLLIPGATYTGMTARTPTKPPGSWTADQVIAFMMDSLKRGDFYILCPDNDVTRAMDEKRMQWAADDAIKNRPALSRWDPAFKDAFDAWMRDVQPK